MFSSQLEVHSRSEIVISSYLVNHLHSSLNYFALTKLAANNRILFSIDHCMHAICERHFYGSIDVNKVFFTTAPNDVFRQILQSR